MSEKTGNDLFIVDNTDSDWKVLSYLSEWSEISSRFDIATGNFEVGALLALDGKWQKLGVPPASVHELSRVSWQRDVEVDEVAGNSPPTFRIRRCYRAAHAKDAHPARACGRVHRLAAGHG